MGITGPGQFKWNAAETKKDYGLSDDDQFSLMLSSDFPIRRWFSPNFRILSKADKEDKLKRSIITRKDTPQGTTCMNHMIGNGGTYNHTTDDNFHLDSGSGSGRVGIIRDRVSGWEVNVKMTGSTTVTYEGEELPGSDFRDITVHSMGVNLINVTNQGMGIVALSELQRKRNMDAGGNGNPANNVIGLYLGSGDTPGHVVMGGHDQALIDQTQGSAVYGKREYMEGQFEVQLTSITYIPDTNSDKRATSDGITIPMNKTPLRLAYNSPTILLPEVILEELRPHLGISNYKEELGGYVYDHSPKTDYSLKFTFTDSTSGQFVNITVPATSLLTEETVADNPLTSPQIESGRKYMLLAPLRDSSPIGYLGRAFLQHIYMVEDGYLEKFYISAVNITAVRAGISNPVIRSYGLMDSSPIGLPPEPTPVSSDSGPGDNKTPLVASILGGVIGGVAVLWLIFLFLYLRRRRTRSRLGDQIGDGDADVFEKESEHLSTTMTGARRSERSSRGGGISSREKDGGDETRVVSRQIREPPAAIIATTAPEEIRKNLGSATRDGKMTSAFIMSGTSSPGNPHNEMAPPLPVKDAAYLRDRAHKRYSQPIVKNPEYAHEPPARKRQSVPLMALESMSSGLYAHALRNHDTAGGVTEEREINSPHPIPTYHQLIAHHQARRQRASYVDSASSNDNADDNDTRTTATNSTETATVGKIITKGQVAKIRQLSSTPPHVALANSLERRASVGRVMSPGDIVIVEPPSRRTSRSSRELLHSPRKSPSPPASSSHSGSGSGQSGGATGSASLGHRRGRSAPVDLGLPPSTPTPPPKSRDDISTGGARRVSVPAPRARPVSQTPVTFLDDASSYEASSSSSMALPHSARLVQRTGSDSSDGSGGDDGPFPVSALPSGR